jgi:hypothetical protein
LEKELKEQERKIKELEEKLRLVLLICLVVAGELLMTAFSLRNYPVFEKG